VQTASDGTYTIPGIRNGKVLISFVGADWIIEWWENSQRPAGADRVRVRSGQDTPGIDARLRPAGKISGRVTDTSGNPIANTCVIGFGADYGVATFTGPYGNYTVPSLQWGPATVLFPGAEDCNNGAYAPEWYDDKPDQASADPVEVQRKRTTPHIKATLAPLPAASSSQSRASWPTQVFVIHGQRAELVR
jgi:hypothetical protein